MEKRWNVYHGSESLGLKTAKEIREALRHGSLDPFDKVSLEGSNIREDLVEVDEIFREHAPDGTEMDELAEEGTQIAILPEAARSPVLAPPPSVSGRSSAPLSHSQPSPSQSQVSTSSSRLDPLRSWVGGQGSTAAAIENISETAPNYGNDNSFFKVPDNDGLKAPVKRYYILDKERVLGPLSALDIQAPFNRGVLGKKVRVQKMGSSRALPIAQFIENYAGDRMKELAEDGKIPKHIGFGSPSSKVLNELARMADSRRMAKNQQNRVYAIAGGVLALLFIIFTVIYERSKNSPSTTPSKVRNTQAEETPKEVAAPLTKTQRPRLVQKPPVRTPAPEAPPPISEPELPRIETRRLDTPPRQTPAPKSAPPLRQTKRQTSQVVPAPQNQKPVSRPAAPVIPARAQEPRPRPSAIAAKGPIAKATESAGRIQTVGPLSFSPASLDACPAKCNLSLSDAAGASMKAVFFKSAYFDQLKSRSKAVTLTGSTKLEGGELVLIIQDLR